MTTVIPFGLVAEGDREVGLQSVQAAAVPRTHALQQGDSVFIVLGDEAKCVHSESGRHAPDQVLPIVELFSAPAESLVPARPPSPWLVWLKVVPFLIWNWQSLIRAFLPEKLENVP